jgi:DivIVA domain-containing protein
VDLDRQAIERRDFPIGRRGYDPASVDAHLRALAAEVQELQAAARGAADLSLASTASSQVQGIIEAAETAAAEIERQAAEGARQVREAAARDAQRTREEALEKARAHVSAVAEVTATLLERVGAMDGEVRALLDSLRAGAGRLAGDLAAVDTNMGELYDAASGRRPAEAAPAASAPPRAAEAAPPPGVVAATASASDPVAGGGESAASAGEAAAPASEATEPARGEGSDSGGSGATGTSDQAGDLDGARLIALNMALNGEPRAETERYLAENFELPDRGRLVDEVYAAIEG